MVVKYINVNRIPKLKPNIACIGYFDGVHIGHQKLIKETIKQAKKNNCISTLICFNPDPIDIICKKKSKHLLSFKSRLSNIESFGIEQVVVIKFDERFMKISPTVFIRNYLNKLNIVKLICGYDFTFGHKGKGNIETLMSNKSFETIVINECKYRGSKVSTTRIKEELLNGNFKLVNKLLGYDYSLKLYVLDCRKNKNGWLIEAKLSDKQCIMPNDKTIDDGFYIKNKRIYILSSSRVNKGETLYSIFTYE